jgi:hypothetical protein
MPKSSDCEWAIFSSSTDIPKADWLDVLVQLYGTYAKPCRRCAGVVEAGCVVESSPAHAFDRADKVLFH